MNGGSAPADIVSSNVSSIELNGIPVGSDEELFRARVGAQASFTAKSAIREDYRNLITALAAYVVTLKEAENDPDLILRPREAGFRLVVIRSVIRAESSELKIAGSDATDPNSVASLQIGGGVSLNVQAGSSTSCARPQGSVTELPACFFNVAVFDPQYVAIALHRINTYSKI